MKLKAVLVWWCEKHKYQIMLRVGGWEAKCPECEKEKSRGKHNPRP